MTMDSKSRKCLPTLPDLIDEMTINQIKQVILKGGIDSFGLRMQDLMHDVDMLLKEHQIEMTADLVGSLIALAQANLHIWINKDLMQERPEQYTEYLEEAHKLNGIRNRIKNHLLELSGETSEAAIRTNVELDGLPDWSGTDTK